MYYPISSYVNLKLKMNKRYRIWYLNIKQEYLTKHILKGV